MWEACGIGWSGEELGKELSQGKGWFSHESWHRNRLRNTGCMAG